GRLPGLARELVKRGVDVIATTGGTVAAQAALKMTQKIPVLFISGFDPRKAGLLKFRNATGVHVATTESAPERLAVLRQLVPGAEKFAVLRGPKTFVFTREKAEAAKKGGLFVVTADSDKDLPTAISTAKKKGAGALLVCADPFFTSRSQQIVDLANEYGLP